MPDIEKQELREYVLLRETSDAIEAFNLFIKRNCPDRYAHFIDSDDNEGEYVRRAIVANIQSEKDKLLDELLEAVEQSTIDGMFNEWNGLNLCDIDKVKEVIKSKLSGGSKT